mgnify:CR=1 FL=1
MIVFLFDGTETGLYCALFTAYTQKKFPDLVTTDGEIQQAFGDEAIRILSDGNNAERVKKGLSECRTKGLLADVRKIMRWGDKLKYTVAFRYLRLALDNKPYDVSENYADPTVLAVRDAVRKIGLETHRMTGFLRFTRAEKGYFYARYEPDNDITDLLMPHFAARFRIQPFLIHDTKRNILGAYDGKKTIVLPLGDRAVTYFPDREEDKFLKLWRLYYDSVTIPERKNEKQMYGYMPARYHKNLPEKNRGRE